MFKIFRDYLNMFRYICLIIDMSTDVFSVACVFRCAAQVLHGDQRPRGAALVRTQRHRSAQGLPGASKRKTHREDSEDSQGEKKKIKKNMYIYILNMFTSSRHVSKVDIDDGCYDM